MGSISLANQPERPFLRPRFDLLRDINESHDVRSLPDLVHFNAQHNPTHTFAIQEERKQGKLTSLMPVNFSQLQSLIKRCIDSLSSLQKSETRAVAIYLESDLTLFVYLCALLWMDIPVILLSIRLSPVAVAHLLRETSATAIICSARTQRPVTQALKLVDEAKPEIVLCQPYPDFLRAKGDPHIEPPSRLTKDSPGAIFLHSSGTTGLPKPIALAPRYLLGYAACHQLTPAESECRLNVSTLPLYHGFGFLAPCLSLSVGKPCCFPSAAIIPNPDTTIELLRVTGAKSLMTVPTVLEQLPASLPRSHRDELARLDFIAVGGGPLKLPLGDALKAQGITILNHYGATEIGALAHIHIPDDKYNWHFLRIRDDIGLQLRRVEDPNEIPRFKLVGHPFGWARSFEVQDSLVKNDAVKGVEVRLMGRTDDLIVLATGEKVLPHHFESRIEDLDFVRSAIVFGHQRDEVGVLVETHESSMLSKDEHIAAVWSVLEELNLSADRHARVSSKEFILFKPSGMTIPRSDKGSIMRKEVYDTFAEEIAAVYARLASISPSDTKLCESDIEGSIRNLLCLSVQDRLDTSSWTLDDDFFEAGMDSLEAIRLARSLARIANPPSNSGIETEDMSPAFVYRHPSIRRIMAVIQGMPDSVDPLQDCTQDLTAKYLKVLQSQPLCIEVPVVVALTGSTGNLGAHLLRDLALNDRVHRIICLNRASSKGTGSLRERQERSNVLHGLDLPQSAWDKIELCPSDTSQPYLGLSRERYDEMASRVTLLVHNAWPMDFQRNLKSYQSQLQTVCNLVNLCRSCRSLQHGNKPKLVFLSSIAVASHDARRRLPEANLADPRSTATMGYARAKWVCEQLLQDRSVQEAVNVNIVRIGQLSGSLHTGYWNEREHFPALLRASHVAGVLPDLQGSFSWLPVDLASKVVTEIAFSESKLKFYHVENPIRQPWSQLLEYIAYSQKSLRLAKAPFGEWLGKVGEQENMFPLMEFFKSDFRKLSGGQLILDTKNTRAVSPSLCSCSGISQELVGKYLAAWSYSS